MCRDQTGLEKFFVPARIFNGMSDNRKQLPETFRYVFQIKKSTFHLILVLVFKMQMCGFRIK